MKSLREIVWSVIEFVSGFHVTDDNPFDEGLIAKKADDVRATLIKQEWLQDKKVNDLFYQKMNVGIVDKNIDPEKEVEIKSFYVQFAELLPNVGWANIKYLGKNSLTEKYNRRSIDGYGAGAHRRWSSEEVDYTVVGLNQALVRNEKLAKDIIIIGLFKSPTDVPGVTWDDPYPVPDPFRLEMIIKQDIMAGLGIKADEKNDARHNQEEIIGRK